MLIVGLQLFGFGDEKPIKIQGKDIKAWPTKLFEEGPGTLDIKMKSPIPEIGGEKNKNKDP